VNPRVKALLDALKGFVSGQEEASDFYKTYQDQDDPYGQQVEKDRQQRMARSRKLIKKIEDDHA
jgi:hypothetical protein